MSLTLLQCQHQGCGLYFRDQYDLTSHVEFVHLPAVEEEKQKKAASGAPEEPRTPSSQPMNVPLSYVSRFFRKPQDVKPITYEPFRISFNHFRKRPAPSYSRNDSISEDMEECPKGDSEVRFRCHVVDCSKRFKNGLGLKLHLKSEHGIESQEANGSSNDVSYAATSSAPPANVQPVAAFGSSGVLSPAVLTPMTPGATAPAGLSINQNVATKPHKCTHCAKRYKTATGLSNHQFQAHQKSAGMAPGPEPSGEDAAKLLVELRHQQQKEVAIAVEKAEKDSMMASAQQAAADRRHIQAMAFANQHHVYENGKNGGDIANHVPVRSIASGSQPLRFSQSQAHQATGHVLVQQMQQQRKQAKLLQAQNPQPPSGQYVQVNSQPVQQNPP